MNPEDRTEEYLEEDACKSGRRSEEEELEEEEEEEEG